jgi:hypothetical protein
MKTKTKKFILLLVSALFLQGSCVKETDKCPTYNLPPATQTGANTIGCLVDGVVLIPKKAEGAWNQPTVLSFKYIEETGELSWRIKFAASERDYGCGYLETSLRFVAYEVLSAGTIKPNKFGAEIDIYPTLYGGLKLYRYTGRLTGLTSNLKITKLDTISNIISGTFELEMYENIGGDDDYNFDIK